MTAPKGIPAHLRLTQDYALASSAIAGIRAGAVTNRLSYRGSRWHLVDKDGNETDPYITNDQGQAQLENHGVAIDLVIVGALPHVSKLYYDKPYNAEVDEPPACFSDNGIAPSERAARPQAEKCSICPHNVWTLNSETGKQRQACTNSKKLAVVRYYDTDNTVYALTVPAASLKTYQAVVARVTADGWKLGGIVFRVSFDSKEAFPKLVWNGITHLDEESMAELEALGQSDEVRLAIGADDAPMTPEQFAIKVSKPVSGAYAAALEAARVLGHVSPVQGGLTVPTPQDVPQHTRQAMRSPANNPARQPQTAIPSVGPAAPAPAAPAPAAPAPAAPAKRGPGRPRKNPDAPEGAALLDQRPLAALPPQDTELASPSERSLPENGPDNSPPPGLPPAPPEMESALARAMKMKV